MNTQNDTTTDPEVLDTTAVEVETQAEASETSDTSTPVYNSSWRETRQDKKKLEHEKAYRQRLKDADPHQEKRVYGQVAPKKRGLDSTPVVVGLVIAALLVLFATVKFGLWTLAAAAVIGGLVWLSNRNVDNVRKRRIKREARHNLRGNEDLARVRQSLREAGAEDGDEIAVIA